MTEIDFKELAGEKGDIGKIILNHPQKLNALNWEMCQAIHDQLKYWSQKKSIKAVIICSAGGKAFCAGGDVLTLYENCLNQRYEAVDTFFKIEYAMNQALFSFKKPYLAFLDGITMGGGVGISIHGSHPIATERLVWAMPETSIGFFPDVGVCYYLAQLPNFMGNFLALSAERIEAEFAYRLGMVKAIISSARLYELENILLNTPFGSRPFDTVTDILKKFHQASAIVPEKEQSPPFNSSLIKKIFAADSVEEIFNRCSLEPDPWSQKLMLKLRTLSPLSLKITLKHLQNCRKNNFEQVMAENYILATHFIRDPNFLEGIRAVLVDKDQVPHWRPALEEINGRMIENFFI